MKYNLDFNEKIALQVSLIRQVRELNSLRNTWVVSSRASIRADLRRTISILRKVQKSVNVQLETVE
jgi:hypothetical protein